MIGACCSDYRGSARAPFPRWTQIIGFIFGKSCGKESSVGSRTKAGIFPPGRHFLFGHLLMQLPASDEAEMFQAVFFFEDTESVRHITSPLAILVRLSIATTCGETGDSKRTTHWHIRNRASFFSQVSTPSSEHNKRMPANTTFAWHSDI